MRKVQFANGEYYHIYNRGTEQREIFKEKEDCLKFLRSLREFNNKSYYEERLAVVKCPEKELSSFLGELEKVVEVLSFSLIPNHFHLILKQVEERGISNFMHKLGTSFTNYFNKKYNRVGSLFQGVYKAIHIDSNEYLLWLSAYVNGNSEIHKIKNAEFFDWSSYKNFLDKEKNEILDNMDIILSQFNNPLEYKKFVEMAVKESQNRKEMKKHFLE